MTEPTNAELAAMLREEATAPGCVSERHILLAAQRLEARGEISEAMVTRAFQVFDSHQEGTSIDAMRAALKAALSGKEE